MLHSLLKQIDRLFDSQQYLKVMYRALFSTTYFGLFRIGELTQSAHVLRARDVHVAKNKKKFLFILRSSKMHGKDAMPQRKKKVPITVPEPREIINISPMIRKRTT